MHLFDLRNLIELQVCLDLCDVRFQVSLHAKCV